MSKEVATRTENKEHVYEDFISRTDFINNTGIFVTDSMYMHIYEEYKKQELPLAEFIKSYEEKHVGEICECELKGTLKYCVLDEEISCLDNEEKPNIWEILNCFEESKSEEKEQLNKLLTAYKKIVDDAVNTLEMIQLQSADATIPS